MTSPRPGSHRDRPSVWKRARRDLATPQGSNLMSALFLCFILPLIGVILESLFDLPNSVMYPVIIAIVIAEPIIIVVVMFKISAMNKRAEEARRETYRQKFEQNMEEIKAWSEKRARDHRKGENREA
jgi:hypothetical protein